MSAWYKVVWGYLYNGEVGEEVEDFPWGNEKAGVPSAIIDYGEEENLLFGARTRQFSVEPEYGPVTSRYFTRYDIGNSVEHEELRVKVDAEFNEYLATLPEEMRDRSLWIGPETWFCPHS